MIAFCNLSDRSVYVKSFIYVSYTIDHFWNKPYGRWLIPSNFDESLRVFFMRNRLRPDSELQWTSLTLQFITVMTSCPTFNCNEVYKMKYIFEFSYSMNRWSVILTLLWMMGKTVAQLNEHTGLIIQEEWTKKWTEY